MTMPAVALLIRCWAALDGPAGKRLHPALPETLANMERHGHLTGIDQRVIENVLAMSAATIDRRLAPAREGLETRKQISHTRPGSMLKSSIPMKTWHEWNESEPGFVQIDLVGHEGGDNNGAFFYSLDATDIATGWTESVTVRSKGEKIVAAGLAELQLRFPFHHAGIHSDNGSEGVHQPPPRALVRSTQDHLHPWPRQPQERPGLRRAEELDGGAPQRRLLPLRHPHRTRPPQPTLAAGVPAGEPVPAAAEAALQDPHRRDRPQDTHDTATTPLRRLLDQHGDIVDPHDRADLERLLTDTDLIGLRHQIADIQGNLIGLARHRGIIQHRAKTNAVYLSRRKLDKRASPDESTNEMGIAS